MPETTIREALRQTLREELQQDESIVLMGEDIGAYGGSYGVTRGLLEEFGDERVRDTPISESVVVGCGIGAAMGGIRPVVELMTINFSFLAFDQIINNASKLHYMSGGQINVPLVIRMASGGGSQLGAQHSHDLAGWYAHVPGLKVATPSTPYDARGLLKTALREENPVIFVEHTAIYGLRGEVPEEDYSVPFGQAQVMREGGDVTHHRLLRQRPPGAAGGGHAGAAGHGGGSAQPAHAAPSGRRRHRQLGQEDRLAPSSSRTTGASAASPARSSPSSRSAPSTTSTPRSPASAAPTCRCPTPSELETAALPSEQQIVDAALAMR